MKRYSLRAGTELVLLEGDITKLDMDAIVNAANERMLGGGGVDGAIHRAAGPELLEACKQVPEVRPGVRCPTGEARITPGFLLPSNWVIHTVGPRYKNAQASAPLLTSAYRSSLALANEQGLSSIAFPAISCGIYGYPLADAATIAIETCREHTGSLESITFALFGANAWQAFASTADRLLEP